MYATQQWHLARLEDFAHALHQEHGIEGKKSYVNVKNSLIHYYTSGE